jgi:hypothetical protein
MHGGLEFVFQYGVKGPSVLMELNTDHFGVPTSFTIDALHAICLGVLQRLAERWFHKVCVHVLRDDTL